MPRTRNPRDYQAQWEEIDEQSARWWIPDQRMKGRIIHIVPAFCAGSGADRSTAPLTGHTELLFPAKIDAGCCMSDNTLNKALRCMGEREFRMLAATLLREHGWPEAGVERQLAHVDRNKVRADYNHA
jgi:integrase